MTCQDKIGGDNFKEKVHLYFLESAPEFSLTAKAAARVRQLMFLQTASYCAGSKVLKEVIRGTSNRHLKAVLNMGG